MFEKKKHLLCLALLTADTVWLSVIVWGLVSSSALPGRPFGASPGWDLGPKLAELLVFAVLAGAWSVRLHFSDYHERLLAADRESSLSAIGAVAVLQGTAFFLIAGWLLGNRVPELVTRTACCALCGLAYVVLLSPSVSQAVITVLGRRGLTTRVLLCTSSHHVEGLLSSFVLPYAAALSPVGLVHTDGVAAPPPSGLTGVPVLNSAEQALTFLTDGYVQAVVIGETADGWPHDSLLQRCTELGIPCWRVDPETIRHEHSADARARCRDILVPDRRSPSRLLAKEAFDAFASLLLLACLWPLMAAIAVLVRVTSGGPVLFRQERNGLYGKPFVMYKFRSMRVGSEAMHHSLAAGEPGDILFKPANDPRVTRFGRFLRRSSLDELPQLWNVLRGEMSLVGPRPMPPYETNTLARPADRRRLCMKPGLTGLWQVSGRSTIRTMAERVGLDVAYVDNWSLRQDMWILLKTIPIVLSARGAQ